MLEMICRGELCKVLSVSKARKITIVLGLLTFNRGWDPFCFRVLASSTRTYNNTAGKKSFSNFSRMPFAVPHSNRSSHWRVMAETSGSTLVRLNCWIVSAEETIGFVKNRTMVGSGKLLGNEFARAAWRERREANEGMELHRRNRQISWRQLIRYVLKSGSFRDRAFWHKRSPKPSFIRTLANSGPQPRRPTCNTL